MIFVIEVYRFGIASLTSLVIPDFLAWSGLRHKSRIALQNTHTPSIFALCNVALRLEARAVAPSSLDFTFTVLGQTFRFGAGLSWGTLTRFLSCLATGKAVLPWGR